MQGTTLDPGNAAIRSFFADTYSDLAEAEATLAQSQSLAADERRKRWQSARNFYARSLEIWHDLAKRSIIAQADRGKQEAISRQIARCEAALH